MNRTTISLDLAKRIIQVCKVTSHGEVLFNKAMSPDDVRKTLMTSRPGIVAMEGCGSFHYWGRLAQEHGHEVRAMPPKKVKPFIGKQKTDANDAIGIYVASQQPNMTFCSVKNIEQHSVQNIQTSRQFLERTLNNIGKHIGALLYEYGIVFGKGRKALRETMICILEPQCTQLSAPLKQVLVTLWEQYQALVISLDKISKQLTTKVKQTEPCKRLMALEGVGEIGAAGLYASLGDGAHFKNGRQASAYIGVTPKQHSSGGKVIMLGIDKQGGDKSLRAILFLGALSIISCLPSEPITEKQKWLIALVKRCGVKRACIALVNKNIRTAWALLRYAQPYKAAML